MGRDEILALLTNDLTAEGGSEIVVDETPGPLGTTVVVARALEGLYPGGNARAAVIDGERGYGRLVGPGLGAFLHDRALDAATVPIEALLALHAAMALDDGLVLDTEVAPERRETERGVVITFASRDPMSGASTMFELDVPSDGPIVMRAAPEGGAEVRPITPAVGLERALADGDALAMMRAVEAVAGPIDDTTRGLLAKIAVLPNETIAYAAVSRLDPVDASVAALRTALHAADADTRKRVSTLVTQAHGAEIARRLGEGR